MSKKGKVFYGDKLAGIISETDQGYVFAYDKAYLKNFSLLHSDEGISLCPAYDLVNVNLVNPADKEDLALTLNAKKKKLKLTDFITLADSLNIPAEIREASFRKFMSMNDKVESMIDASFLDQASKEKYKLIWQQKQRILQPVNS